MLNFVFNVILQYRVDWELSLTNISFLSKRAIFLFVFIELSKSRDRGNKFNKLTRVDLNWSELI